MKIKYSAVVFILLSHNQNKVGTWDSGTCSALEQKFSMLLEGMPLVTAPRTEKTALAHEQERDPF